MNKKIFIINLILIVLLFFTIDIFVFYKLKDKYNINVTYLQNLTKKINKKETKLNYIINNNPMRQPLNTNYNAKPVIFTGCSFIYGEYLKENQIISYKISKLIKNPVYNFASLGWGINHTLFLLETGYISKNINKEPAVIIYNYADFHILRMLIPNMIFEQNEILYRKKENHLILKESTSIISRFPIIAIIRENFFDFLLNKNSLYQHYCENLLFLHFSQIKKYIDKNFKNTKFVILLYAESPHFEKIAPLLEEQGIIIIRIKEEYGYNLYNDGYQLPDGHPNAKVWEIITPKLYESLVKNRIELIPQ